MVQQIVYKPLANTEICELKMNGNDKVETQKMQSLNTGQPRTTISIHEERYINHAIVTTTATDAYILPFINMLHAAYVCKIIVPDDG
jgi:hypothetical protein